MFGHIIPDIAARFGSYDRVGVEMGVVEKIPQIESAALYRLQGKQRVGDGSKFRIVTSATSSRRSVI